MHTPHLLIEGELEIFGANSINCGTIAYGGLFGTDDSADAVKAFFRTQLSQEWERESEQYLHYRADERTHIYVSVSTEVHSEPLEGSLPMLSIEEYREYQNKYLILYGVSVMNTSRHTEC